MKQLKPGLLLLCGLFLACDSPPLGKVGETFLAQAADTRDLAPSTSAATVELSKLDPTTPPAEAEVRIAAGKRDTWRDLRNAVSSLEQAGKKVVLLTAQRRRIGEFVLYEEVGDRPIEVVTRTNGQACVRLPGVKEAKCVQRADAMHIDRAHLRQLVREAIRVSKLREVLVYVPGDMQWADVVRAVDAARTCCKATMRPVVRLVDLETRDAERAKTLKDEAPAAAAEPAADNEAQTKPSSIGAQGDGGEGASSSGAGSAPGGPGGIVTPAPSRALREMSTGTGAEKKRKRSKGGGPQAAPPDEDLEAPPEEESDEGEY